MNWLERLFHSNEKPPPSSELPQLEAEWERTRKRSDQARLELERQIFVETRRVEALIRQKAR